MKISVIIPTYNEEGVIENCLKSLENQTTKDFEVIVVDDGSTDNTLEILKKLKIENFKFRIMRQAHLGPALARNLGATKARGEVLVFIDSVMTVGKNFVEKLTEPIFDGKWPGTFSKSEYVGNWDNVWARCWNYNQNLPGRKRLPDNYPDSQKVFRAILKSEFDRVKGFDKGGYTDDYTLSDKLSYLAHSVDGAILYHNNPDDLKEVFAQSKWSSKRYYKGGSFGAVVSSLGRFMSTPITGIIKAFKYREPRFPIFKSVYNLGQLIGIFEYLILKKGYK